MTVVPAADRRTTTTPNATMTTLVSPTLGGATGSLWWVETGPDVVGPVHAFAAEVIWAVTRGSATLHLSGREDVLEVGDTAVLPGGALRQWVAGGEGFTAIVTTPRATEVTRGDGTSAGVPPWVA